MKWEGLGSASFATLLVNQILVLPLGLMNHSWTIVKMPTLKPMSGLSDMYVTTFPFLNRSLGA